MRICGKKLSEQGNSVSYSKSMEHSQEKCLILFEGVHSEESDQQVMSYRTF